VVGQVDFTFVALNFLKVGESCAGAFDGPAPRTRVTVKDLRRAGLGHLAAADINGDGWVDARDMQIYAESGGNPPMRPVAGPPSTSAAGSRDW
jgi:hypothetical protein